MYYDTEQKLRKTQKLLPEYKIYYVWGKDYLRWKRSNGLQSIDTIIHLFDGHLYPRPRHEDSSGVITKGDIRHYTTKRRRYDK